MKSRYHTRRTTSRQIHDLQEDIKTSEKINKELQHSHAQQADVIARQTAELDEADAHAELIGDSDKRIESLQKKFEAEIQRVERKVTRIEQERDEVIARLKDVSQEVADFNESKESLMRDLQAIEQANSLLNLETAELEKTVNELRTEVDEKIEQNRTLQMRHKELDLLIADKSEEVEVLKKELEQALAMGTELEATSDMMHVSSKRQEERLLQKEAAHSEMAERCRNQEQLTQELSNKVYHLMNTLEEKAAQIERLEAMLEAQQKVVDVECMVYHDKERLSRENMSKLQAEVREVTHGKLQQEQQITLLRKDLQNAESETAALQERLSLIPEMQADKTSLFAKYAELEDKLACEQDTVKSLRRVIHEKEAAIASAGNQMQNTKESYEEALEQVQIGEAARDVLMSLLTNSLNKQHDSISSFNAMSMHSLATQCVYRVEELARSLTEAMKLNDYLTSVRKHVIDRWNKLSTEVQLALDNEQVLRDEEEPSLGRDTDVAADRVQWNAVKTKMLKAVNLLEKAVVSQQTIESLKIEKESLEDLVEERSDWKETFLTETRQATVQGIATAYKHVMEISKAASNVKRKLRKDAPPECEEVTEHVSQTKTLLTKTIASCFTAKEKVSCGLTGHTFEVKRRKSRPTAT
eukprot:TRINITY_DN9668_c0_g1_i4.p1 TRINITY_DN9668_c0_g1~~TRINITY_DN9668_c0_g1_i4.p1  ORF type:complete len:642 (+),score=141.03 TRINITY_DN9668_c0_g1_i4:267-2192(+)